MLKWFRRNKTSDVIYILGDSHSRAFSYNKNFAPFFVGEGKRFCFINDETAKNVENNVLKIIKGLKTPSNVMLFFGEPDTRHYLGKGWKPWESEIKGEYRGGKLKESIDRYGKIINKIASKQGINLFVLNVTPSNRTEQNDLVIEFNKNIQRVCKAVGVDFIDVFSDIFDDKQKLVKPEYLGDPVHLNNQLQIPVEQYLIRKGVLKMSGFVNKTDWKNENVQKDFKYNKRFGCYTIDT